MKPWKNACYSDVSSNITRRTIGFKLYPPIHLQLDRIYFCRCVTHHLIIFMIDYRKNINLYRFYQVSLSSSSSSSRRYDYTGSFAPPLSISSVIIRHGTWLNSISSPDELTIWFGLIWFEGISTIIVWVWVRFDLIAYHPL